MTSLQTKEHEVDISMVLIDSASKSSIPEIFMVLNSVNTSSLDTRDIYGLKYCQQIFPSKLYRVLWSYTT